MKKFQIHELLAENTLSKVFLAVNFIAFAVIFEWSEFFVYLSKISEQGCKPVPPISLKLSFGVYDIGSDTFVEYILAGAAIVFLIFYLPSYLAATIIVGAMKSDYPHWCAETFDLIFVPIFCFINGVYLIFLSYLMEIIYDYHCRHKSPPENPLNIYPN